MADLAQAVRMSNAQRDVLTSPREDMHDLGITDAEYQQIIVPIHRAAALTCIRRLAQNPPDEDVQHLTAWLVAVYLAGVRAGINLTLPDEP
jgi:hypothetical protein